MTLRLQAVRRCFSLLVIFAALSPAAGKSQTKTATAVANCQSIGLDTFSGTLPGIGDVTNYVTTFDGRTDRQPLTQDLGGGYFYVSQELRPRSGQPGVYEADYLSYTSSGTLSEYGSFTVNLPTTDSDANELPDFAQKDKGGSVSLTGYGQADGPSSYSFTLSGQLDRKSGSTSGSYSLTLNGPLGAIHYAGGLYLAHLSGSVSYSRGSPNLVFLNLSRTDQKGGTTTLTGSTTFTVSSPDEIALPQFWLTSSDNKTYTVNASRLSREGTTYVGPVQLADGTLETSWPDLRQLGG